MRPFKGLVYSQQALQRWCEALEKKFSPQTTLKTETTVDSEVLAASQGGMSGPTQTETQPPAQDKFFAMHKENSADKEEEGGKSVRTIPEHIDDKNEEEDDPDDVSKSLLALKHLKCLLEVIDANITSRRTILREGKCRKAWYSDLWLLFGQGVEVVAKDGKQAYRVIETASKKHGITNSELGNWKKEPPFRVACAYIDFDGKQLGPVCKTFEIHKFDGEKETTSLLVYPLAHHSSKRADFSDSEWELVHTLPEQDRFRHKLIMRGRKFLEMAAVKQMYYTGSTLDALDEVESQIVLGFETALSMNEDWQH